MFKRFVARVLIFFQIYSSLFQGIAYGGYGLLENLPIQDEIYLHGGYAKGGGLRLSLWTSTLTSQKTELLKEIEIPTYEEVKARSRTNSRASSPSPALQLPTSNLSPPSIPDSFPSQNSPSSFSPLSIIDPERPTEIFSDQDSMLAALTDQEDMSDEENSAFESEDGILRTPEGAHFNIQGLKVFLSNSGEMLVQGKQEDFSHPILLSSDHSIILHEVEAFALKLTSGSIISVGESKIDFLSLEGSADDSTIMPQFLNQGTLTAKSVFLKNLNNANNGRLTTDTMEIPEGVFENLGNLRVKEQMTLNAERFTNRGTAAISTLQVLDRVRRLENAENAELEFMQPVYLPPSTATVNEGFMKGSIQSQGTIFNQGFLEGDFLKTSEALTNRGILRSRNIEANGPSFEQTGTITARRLQIGQDTQIITNATQKLEVTEAIESHSQSPWMLEGTVITSTFSHLGRLELVGELITEQFEGHGIINERGRLKAQESRFTDATTILGRATLQHLDASGDVVVQGIVTVRDQATIDGRLYVRENGMLKGKKTKPLTLTLQEGGEIAGVVDVDYLSATKPITLAAKGKLVSRVRTNLFADLLIPAEANAELHYLSSHSKLKNEGNLSIIGVRPGSRLQLINRGSAQVDAGHTLSINSTGNSALFEPDIVLEETRAAQRALAMVDPKSRPEVFTNLNLMPSDAAYYTPYKEKFKKFLQATSEGRLFIEEILGGDINSIPLKRSDFISNNVVQKYSKWYRENYIIPAQITEEIAKKIIVGVDEVSPDPRSHSEIFLDKNPYPNALSYALYKQKFKEFLQATEEGRLFIQEKLDGDISKLPYKFSIFMHDNTVEKYRDWYREHYEIPAQIAERIKQKIEERKLAANSAKFVPDIVLEETRAAQRALDMVDPNAWPEVFTSVNPDPRSYVRTLAQAERYMQKLKEFLQATAEGRQFIQEVLSGDINSMPPNVRDLIKDNPIKKYQIWFRERYENQEIMVPEIIKKAITGEFDVTLDPRALPEVFTNSNLPPKTPRQVQTYIQNLKTFLQVTEMGRQYIREELGDNFDGKIITPRDCYLDNPIEKYRVWLQARYNRLIQTSQRIREKIDTHQSAQEQWQRQLSGAAQSERPIWIEGVNHSTGQLTLKSGRFDFTGEGAFVNQGTLVQEQAAVHWLAKASEDFNTGTWRVKGSLQLDEYRSENLGNLEVEDILKVTTPDDAMEAFKGLAEVKTQRLVMHAPSLRDVTPEDKILPWVLELHLAQDFETKAKMTTGPLELFCKAFKPGGKLFTQQLDLVSELADLNIDSIVFGRDYIRLATDRLSIDGRVVLPGKACPNILYTRSGSGFHSEGPVMLDVKEHWRNYYGTISASYYQLTGPSLANTAGYIEGRDETQKSFLRMARIEHTRDAQGSYQDWGQCTGHASSSISAARRYNHDQLMWCPNGKCTHRPLSPTCETSDESVITHKGDLELVYDSLDVMVSQITSAKTLTFIAQGHVKEIGDAFDHHLGTRSQERNGKKPQIRSRHFQGDLGDTLLAGTLRAESVAIMAANMTLQNMQLPSAQKGAVVRIVEQFMRPGHSKLYELTDAGYDTVIPWAQKQVPHSIALVGKDAESLPETFGTQFTFRALENIMGPLFLDLYRGVSYLGLSLDLLMEQAVEFVRVQKGTTTTIHRIQDGDTTREIEVVKNPDITMEDLKKSGIPMVLMEFVKNLNRVEDDLKATKYAEDLKKIAVEACAIFPAEKDARSGIFAEKAPANIDITERSFTSIGSVVSAHGGFINVPNGRADFLAHAVTVGDANNYYQVLNRPEIENLGVKSEGEEHVFKLETRDGISLEGAILTAADKDSLLDIETQGMYDDQAAYIQSRQTTFSSTKKTSTTTIIDRSIAQSSEYNGEGMVAVKSSMGIVMQAPTLNTTTNLLAPSVAFTEAHDAISVQTITEKKGKRKWYGASGARKTTQESMRSWLSKGAKIKGKLHVNTNKAHCVNPTISRGAEVVIHASETIDIAAGVNQSDYQMQSTYKGAVWNKRRMTQESRTTHVNSRIDGDVYFYTSKATMQRRAGSGPIANITSDVPIDYVDMIDQHHYTSKSQKSLSAGAAMIVRLGVALLVANPFAGGGLSSTMAGAGFDTLCSEAAINMIENDGNPGRALQAMREKNIVKMVARSVTAAGLTGALGVGTAPISVESFAKEFLARSAVSTTMAIAFDGVKPGEAIRQGALNAAVQTVGACIANKIGDLADSKMGTEQIGDITQEIFHGFLGAGIGAGTAAIMGQDIGKGATSGAIGAVVGHSTAKISGSKALGDLVAVAVAMMTDQDVGIAYMTSNNATEHNFNRHKANPIEGLVKAVKEGMQPQEGENVSQEQADYMQGRDEYVNKALEKASQKQGGYLSAYEINHVIETASNMYAYKYTADKMQALAGQTVVKGAEILIPGMQGINQAWMGVVNHARGELPAGALANEVISGIESSLIDGALAVVTLGVSNYYRTAKVAVGAVKTAATLEAGSVALSPKAKIYLDRKLFQEHHIISNKSKYTRNHELLELAGFDLNSSANKMFLPTRSGANISTTSRSIHEGRHLESVSKSLARQMDEIVKIGPTFGWGPPQYHNELMQILYRERTTLKSGDRILNTHYRPWATNAVGGNLK